MYFLFAAIVTLSLLVILSRNVVYSLACLISTFFFSALLMLLVRLEFLGYVLVVVYVGAIAILFLFVVMTLDINQEERASSVVRNFGGYYSHVAALAFSSFVLWTTFSVVGPLSDLLERFSFVFDA